MSQFPNKSILASTDFSEYSKVALDMCLGVSGCMKTKLYVLHTIEKLPHDFRHLSSSTTPEGIRQKLEEDTLDKIKAMVPEKIMVKGDVIPLVRLANLLMKYYKLQKRKM